MTKRYEKIEEKALSQTKFQIGDMIDISITYKWSFFQLNPHNNEILHPVTKFYS